MTNEAKSLEQRIVDYQAASTPFRAATSELPGNWVLCDELIADRQRLIERNEKLTEECKEGMEREKEDIREARRIGSGNTVGAGMSMGALETWQRVLNILNRKDDE